ncbi:MAG TPA: hypothetical protein VGA29_01860 [Ignavibacteriaceae bacterium]
MKKTIATFVLTTLFAVSILLSSCNSPSTENTDKEKLAMVEAEFYAKSELKLAMRKLWENHVVWTRNVIFCLVDRLPGKDQAVNRLLQNQVDLGNAIKPYYGEEAGKKLTDLLYPHITIAAEVVNSAKAGNTAALDEANKKWYANADEISEFLSTANPNWGLEEMKMMMHEHLKLTTNEAVQRIKKDYDADVIAYDKVHEAILKMSDMLADGIVKQFPEKFTISSTK